MCVYELVKFTDQIKKSITASIDISVLKEKTKGLYTPFRVNAARKVASGMTSIDEVLKVAF
jgi:type II secretory ATPase GspE/PulE/Tfp pilus assembly ATPase PilB-like protein